MPSDIIVEATDVLTVVDIGNAIVTGGADSVTITNNAPDSFPLGNTVVTWTVSARSENIASDTQSVTVEDTTKPVFDTFPDDVVVTSANRFVVNFENPTVTEIFPVTVLCDYKSDYAFFSGRTPVTCGAIDINDNFVVGHFYVTVNPP